MRTATLIEQARAEVKNSVLVDNGDVIQRSPLGDYMAAKELKEGDVHPVYKAMNTLNYAVGNLATMSSITVSTSCTRRWPGEVPRRERQYHRCQNRKTECLRRT